MKELSPIHIRIQNFQSISDLEIEINGFTCITGITNIGKSAIIRAISSALLNNPVVNVVRDGEKFCAVSMESKDWGFIWEKGEPKSGINRYKLKRPEEKKLDKVGQGQLENIASMGFTSVQVGSKVIQPWLASQFEPIFLLNLSGPTVTDFISDISRLKVLQNAILLNVREKKRALDIVKIKLDEVEVLKEKEQRLLQLDTLVTLNSELQAQYESIQEYEEKIHAGEALNQNLEYAAKSIQALQSIRDVEIPEDDVGRDLEEFQIIYKYWVELETAAKGVIILRDIISVNIPEPPDRVSQIVQIATLAERIDRLSQAISILSTKIAPSGPGECPSGLAQAEGILTHMEAVKSEEDTFRGQLAALETELNKVKTELTQIPVCSTCKRPWFEEHSHTDMN